MRLIEPFSGLPVRIPTRGAGWRRLLAVGFTMLMVVACTQSEPADSGGAQAALCDRIEEWEGGVDAIVFLEPEATAQQIAAIEATLAADGSLAYVFVDQTAAFEEFQALFSNSDQIRTSVTVEEMPASFRVSVADGAALDNDSALVQALQVEPVVNDVVLSSEAQRGLPTDC